jgi:hypothetical protein
MIGASVKSLKIGLVPLFLICFYPSLCICQSAYKSEFQLLQKLPKDIVKNLRGGKPNADGLVSHNADNAYLGAEYQRGTMDTLIAGAVLGKKDWIEEGFRVVDVTFAHQDEQGGFGDKVPTGGAFWITALARAFLVLQESPSWEEYRPRAESYYPKIDKALDFLSKNIDSLVKHDRRTPNRLFIDADAFFLSSRLMNKDHHLIDARYLQKLGIQLFDSNWGVFRENGGGDFSYQAVNLLMLIYYYLYYPSLEMEGFIKKGEVWEFSKLKPDGTLDVSANTRAGKGQEIYFGKPKDVNYREVMQMFEYFGVLFNNPQAVNAAQLISKMLEKSK